MSDYSNIIRPFLDEQLIPEILKLNLELVSLEEFGYQNDRIIALRNRITKLTPIYDFLIEYVDGEEECDWYILRDLMSMTGLAILSERTVQPEIIQPSPVIQTNLLVTLNDIPYSTGQVPAGEYNIRFVAPEEIDTITIQHAGDSWSSTTNEFEFINMLLAPGMHQFVITEKIGGATEHSYTITIEAV